MRRMQIYHGQSKYGMIKCRCDVENEERCGKCEHDVIKARVHDLGECEYSLGERMYDFVNTTVRQ